MKPRSHGRWIRISLVVLLAGAAFGLGACSSLRKLMERGRVQSPRASIESARVDRLSFTEADLLFDVAVENPNPIGVSLAGFDYDLSIDGTSFLKGTRNDEVTINPEGKSTVQLPLTLVYEDLLRTFRHLGEKESASYRLECGLHFDLPGLGKVRVPAGREGEVPVLRFPSVKLVSFRITDLDFTQPAIALTFGLRNPNALTFFIDGLRYKLAVNGAPWAEGESPGGVELKGKGDALLTIPVRLNTFNIGQTGYKLLFNRKQLAYRVSGEFLLSSPPPFSGNIDLPFEASGTIDPTR